LAVGKDVLSAFAGAADHRSFPNLYHASKTKTVKVERSEELKQLECYYSTVRQLREGKQANDNQLKGIFEILIKNYKNDWLLALEIYEITQNDDLKTSIYAYLIAYARKKPKLSALILEGLELLQDA